VNTVTAQAPGEAQYQAALVLFGEGRHGEGVKALGQAVQVGHVPAMSLLGGQLITGRGVAPDPITGIRLILAAAEQGGGFACAIAATLYASGMSGKTDWARGLDYLQRAAEVGLPAAQEQLRVLAGKRAGANWKALRRAINPEAWKQVPERRTLSADPLIEAVPGVLPPDLCDALIASARPRLKPARVYDHANGGFTTEDIRSNSAADFGVGDMDMVLLAARERLCAVAGLSPLNADGSQVLHYDVGQRYVHHVDFFDPNVASNARIIATTGQRVATVLVYLNDAGLEGGETDFPRLQLRHRGRKGDALWFRNLDAQGQGDQRTLHAGLPPTAGEKWLLSTWIRDRSPPGLGDPRLKAVLDGR
jgi:prolyl 4-hydroxylase